MAAIITASARMAAILGLALVGGVAHADPTNPPFAATAAPTAPPLVQPPSATKPADGGSPRLLPGIVLGTGIAAIAAGTAIALAYRYNVEGSWEPNLAGLGIACAGVGVAMFGTMLWFNVPDTSTKVSLGPSGVLFSGRF